MGRAARSRRVSIWHHTHSDGPYRDLSRVLIRRPRLLRTHVPVLCAGRGGHHPPSGGPRSTARRFSPPSPARAAVSSLTKTLSAAGLLARAADPHDGRAVVLSLTPAGQDALETAYRAHNRREAEWAHLLTPDELDTLNTVLTKLARAAQTQSWVSHRD